MSSDLTQRIRKYLVRQVQDSNVQKYKGRLRFTGKKRKKEDQWVG